MNGPRPRAGREVFSRRDLLKGGGAMIVGFSLAAEAASTAPAFAARGDLAGPPDPIAIDSWIAIHADNTATLYFGKCELGQGNTTGLLQIAGEELDLDMGQMSAVRLDTNITPDQRRPVQAHRSSAAGRRCALLLPRPVSRSCNALRTRLGVQIGSLVVSKGVVRIDGEPNRSVSYGELLGDKPFNLKFTGTAPQKAGEPIQARRHAGAACRHAGQGGRKIRPYAARARGQYAAWPGGAAARAGRLWQRRQGRAPRREVDRQHSRGACRAPRRLRWRRRGARVGCRQGGPAARYCLGEIDATARAEPSCPSSCARQARPIPSLSMSATWREALPGRPTLRRLLISLPTRRMPPFGPNCALADVRADGALVLSSTQDIYASRKMLATLLGMPVERVRVQYYEGSGTYGHSCYEDAPQAAAIMSQLAGRPVRVQFMRWDELGWDNFGPAQVAEVRAAIDAEGKIVAYTYDGWQHGWHINESSTELAMLTPPAERAAGTLSIVVNRMSTGSMYRVPNRRVVSHAVPMVGLAQRRAAAFAAGHGAVVRLRANHR